MGHRVSGVAFLGALLIALALLAPVAVAAPPLPSNYFGVAREADGATPLPFGTRVSGFIDGVDYSNASHVYDSGGRYSMNVEGNWMTQTGQPNTPEVKEGGDIGDPIMFVAGDMTTTGSAFTATRQWGRPDLGFSENLDLTLAAGQPALVKIARIATRPADGMGQYAYLCNPTPDPVDLSGYYLEKDVPGSFAGPTHPLAGARPLVVPPGALSFVNLTAWAGGADLAPAGDNLKLVWRNAGGTGFGGADIVVDRVEYNATTGGTLYWEPGNTIMSDAAAPGAGQEIRRDSTCGDTNSNAFDFTLAPETGRPGPPVVSLTAPRGGQVWAGDLPHDVTWTMSAATTPGNLTVGLAYSVDRGVSYPYAIAAGLSRAQGPNGFPWTAPCMNSTTVRVRVTVSDGLSAASDASPADLAVVCRRPTVSGVVPGDGSTDVVLSQPLQITFTETMARAPTEAAIAIAPQPVTGVVYTWPSGNVLTAYHNNLAQCTEYTVTVGAGAQDPLGQTLVSPFVWSFSTVCPPTVTVTSPVGGEVWSGGSTHVVSFTTADADPTLSILVQVWDGSFWSPRYGPSPLPTGPGSVSISLPSGDVPLAMVEVDATDSTSLTSWAASDTFVIDGTAPVVQGSVPADGDPGVALTADFQVTFSEPMNGPATESAIGVSPALAVSGVSWDPTGRILTIAHAPLAPGQSYNLTVSRSAKDRSDPGNPLAAEYRVAFVGIAPLVANAGADRAGTVGDTLTFDGSGSTPASRIVTYSWEFRDPEGRSTAKQGRTTSFVFAKAGVWHVLLTVSDGAGGSATDEALVTISEAPGQDVLGVYGGVAAVAIAAAVVALLLFLLLRRRRRKGTETAGPPGEASASAPPQAVAEGEEPREQRAREMMEEHGVADDPAAARLGRAFVEGRMSADVFERNLTRLRARP